ncbi:RDD family protein [Solibacillus sp. FSL H8-0538]|uniref:RDD family protein n=1 Tax=Solibacillus sp. FSL H8-0538 TaxID=2921400 RepID=UPI0030FC871B
MTEIVETFLEVPQPKEQIFSHKTAGFWMRLWAFVMDSLIVSAIIGITIKPIFHLMDWSLAGDEWYAPIAIISAAIYYAYFVIMTKFCRQTLGKMVFGLRVQKDNGEELDWVTVLFREGIGRFINNAVFYLPYLIVGFTPKNKSVADYFADTTVVHEKVYE